MKSFLIIDWADLALTFAKTYQNWIMRLWLWTRMKP